MTSTASSPCARSPACYWVRRQDFSWTTSIHRQIQGQVNLRAVEVSPKYESARTVHLPDGAGNQWRRPRARVGMDAFTLHDLRHFYASGLIAAGCDVMTVQHALGLASF